MVKKTLYETERDKYNNEIKNKNALTFEESSLYVNDIVNVKKEFDKVLNEIVFYKNDIRIVSDNNTDFDNTIAKLKTLSDKISSDLETIKSEINKIKLCSELSFGEYLLDFQKLEKSNDELLKQLENNFTTLEDLEDKKNNLAIDMINHEGSDFQKLHDRYHFIVRQIRKFEDNINNKINKLTTNNIDLLTLLNEGLKKVA